MNIDSIKNGIVIDHIQAKRGMEIYEALNLKALDCSVAIITNAKSKKMGRRDIIQIDKAIDINTDGIGYIDPDVTINIVENDVLVKKYHAQLREKIVNIAKCNICCEKESRIYFLDSFFIKLFSK